MRRGRLKHLLKILKELTLRPNRLFLVDELSNDLNTGHPKYIDVTERNGNFVVEDCFAIFYFDGGEGEVLPIP